MKRLLWSLVVALVILGVGPLAPARADPCQPSAGTDSTGIGVLVCDSAPPAEGHPEAPSSTVGSTAQPTYECRLACGNAATATDKNGAQPCAGNMSCPAKQHLYRLWQVTPTVVPM